jgi:predicted nicotinamide N-methyase
VTLPSGRLSLWALPDPDALLDDLTQEAFDRSDDRMPYWATVWPSAVALADLVLTGESLAGRRVLDLGCGLGLVGLAALHRGARVTFLDWEPAAVEVARATAWTHGFADVEALVADWRSPPPLAPFDRILGADVLYEPRNTPAVARVLRAPIAPGGDAWIADPGRRHAGRFPADCHDAGLPDPERRPLPTPEGAASMHLWRVVPPPPPA